MATLTIDLPDKLAEQTRRFTVADLENGKPGVSAAAYFDALWALGLLNQADELANPDRDEEGNILESARSSRQAPCRQRLDNDF